jgi:hypothetical protein
MTWYTGNQLPEWKLFIDRSFTI